MKTNKVFKWLYGVFMFLPMLAIGVTCAYVTFNKNAKDSYSGINENNVILKLVDNFEVDKKYQLQTHTNTNNSGIIEANNNIVASSLTYNDNVYNNVRLGFYRANNTIQTYCYLRELDNNNNIITSFDVTNTTLTINVSFIYDSISNNFDSSLYQYFNYIDYDTNYYIDNAFYYAVDQFNDSGFNKVDFVSYFDMFYNNTNIWTTFANTYMNYVLFISLAFFIPRVLLWFINLAFAYSDGFERKSQRW